MAGASPKRIDTEKQTFWIRTLKQWESSGEAARAYCVRHGLKETQFYWWKKVLQDRGKWKPVQSRETSTLSTEQPSVPFAAVDLRESLPGGNFAPAGGGPWSCTAGTFRGRALPDPDPSRF